MVADAKVRIALATQGTRGDFQPVLALACRLAKTGHVLKLFGNPDHCKTATEFGFESAAIAAEVKDILQTEAGKKAMETGDINLCAGAMDAVDDTDWDSLFAEEMEEFSPEVLIYTNLVAGPVHAFLRAHPDVPGIWATYQPQCSPTETLGPLSLDRLEKDPDQPNIFRWYMLCQFEARGRYDACEAMRARGLEPSPFDSPHAVFDSFFHVEDSPTPLLCAYSPAWWPAPRDWPKVNLEITGNWKISKEEQSERAQKGASFFDAGGQLARCKEFIEAGPKPVYIGWGSMQVYSKEHMALLAVKALREAGQRGIVVGGWAELSAESLGGAADAAELKEFCAENVLFLKAAPHEWLFPQCSCAVHHGGIGTTQASLSAGLPTIITPVFSDQFDVSAKVQEDKCGFATKHLSKVTAKELAECIRSCCSDEVIQRNVQRLSTQMQNEDGVGQAVQVVQHFIHNDLMTGRWKQRVLAKEARLRATVEKTKKLRMDAIISRWNTELNEMYPQMKAYFGFMMAQHSRFVGLVATKKLLWVKAESGLLVRAGEGLKSTEAGRYREFTILEELGQKGSRLHVRRLKGAGPEEGWVSTTVSGKEMVAWFTSGPEVLKVQGDAVAKVFADIIPPPSEPAKSGGA